uniref:Uncharacterized protein n=1 Tax=Salmo trutta TaxID=8032 RepID=A0A674CGN8_SALTR
MFSPKPRLQDLYRLIISQLLNGCYTNMVNNLIPEVKTRTIPTHYSLHFLFNVYLYNRDMILYKYKV